MDDERRRRDALGSAQTTPGPAEPVAPGEAAHAPTTPAPSGSLAHAVTTPGPDAALPHAPTLDAPPTPPGAPLAAGSAGVATLDAEPADRAPAAELGPGAALGHFVLRRRLGEGGMGQVFAGEDADLGRPVAIKVVRGDAEHPAYRARLLREAQAMARLEHRNVVKVYEVGEARGRLFVAMELIDGETLSAWLHERRSWREIVAMFEQVGAGLAAVHRAGLVHRDFKPDNVLVDREGHARVADFGLARLDRDEASPLAATLTKTGAMMGTPGYMAPEQQLGGDVDARADQYSYCVALREALGGRPLDQARWNAVPAAVRAVVSRGLSYDAADRFAGIDELREALRAAAGAGPDAASPAPRRSRAAIVGAAVVLAAGGIAAAIGLGHRGASPADRAGARGAARVATGAVPTGAAPTGAAPTGAPPAGAPAGPASTEGSAAGSDGAERVARAVAGTTPQGAASRDGAAHAEPAAADRADERASRLAPGSAGADRSAPPGASVPGGPDDERAAAPAGSGGRTASREPGRKGDGAAPHERRASGSAAGDRASDHAHRAAAHAVAVADRDEAGAGSGSGWDDDDPAARSGLPHGAGLNIIVPKTKHWPAAVVGNPAHTRVLLATIRNLGYDGLKLDRPLAAMAKELEQQIATAKGIDVGIAQVELGMVKRRQGDCKAAQQLWRDSGKSLPRDGAGPGPVWDARSRVGFALCDLERGEAEDAFLVILTAYEHGNRSEVKLVIALSSYEKGDKNTALGNFITASKSTDPVVRAALKTWWDGTGLSLEAEH